MADTALIPLPPPAAREPAGVTVTLPPAIADALARLAITAAAPALLDQPAAIRFTGLSRSGWFRARADPASRLPKPVSVPGVGQRWRRDDLARWIDRLK